MAKINIIRVSDKDIQLLMESIRIAKDFDNDGLGDWFNKDDQERLENLRTYLKLLI